MNNFYKFIKIKTLKSYTEDIMKNMDNEQLEDLINSYAIDSNSSISIIDENNNIQYCSNYLALHGKVNDISYEDILDSIELAKTNGGSYLKWIKNGKSKIDSNHLEGTDTNSIVNNPKDPGKLLFSIIYTKIAYLEDNSSYSIVIINTNVAPLNETVKTIRLQLVYVTIIMLIIAMILALIISRKISKPIIKINNSANKLAEGNYDVVFNSDEFKEISELSNTLNYATNELSKTENLRRELIANISHDLRTPLTMITGYAELMRDLPGEDTDENIQVIIDESKRLTSLVNDILDISKFQSGTLTLNLEEFNLTQSIKTIIDRYSKFCEQSNYTIRFIHDDDAYVYADELRISQVVYNLVNNAINYTGNDNLVIVKQNSSYNKVLIEIIDTGEGISSENLSLIWDRYYKIKKSHKRAAIGSGLGLSIVKNILDMHSAEYGVKSTIGQGSIFWFELNMI